MKRFALVLFLLNLAACARSALPSHSVMASCANDRCVRQLIVHFNNQEPMVSVAREEGSILAINFNTHRRNVIENYAKKSAIGPFYKVKVTKPGYQLTYVFPKHAEIGAVWQLTCSFEVKTLSDLKDCMIGGKLRHYYFESSLTNYSKKNIEDFLNALGSALAPPGLTTE